MPESCIIRVLYLLAEFQIQKPYKYDLTHHSLTHDMGAFYVLVRPLASWTVDLKERIKFLKDWINKGIPKVFWISGFYFPQAFITGTSQVRRTPCYSVMLQSTH